MVVNGMVASSKLTTSYTTRHKNEVGVITCVITPTLLKMAATYSPTKRSTIGTIGLNFSVRNGKRWNPNVITT